jgi:hypothetical protein
MRVEVVELAETWRLSVHERTTVERLLEVFVLAFERRLPADLELASVDVSVTKRVAAERPHREGH